MAEKKQKKMLQIPLPQGNVAQYILVGLLIVSAYLVGSLQTKVQLLEQGVGAGVGQPVAQAPAAPSEPQVAGPVPEITDEDYIRGNPDAKIALIEYSDFECPFCNRFHPTAQQIIDTYGDDVMWVYRHYPLAFHPQAQISAEAAECVGDLAGNDGFWEYSDRLFTEAGISQGAALTEDKLLTYAGDMGLDTSVIQSCLDSGKFTAKVKDQMAGGTEAGVTGTPGNILINLDTDESRLIPGAVPFEAFQSVIDEMLEA